MRESIEERGALKRASGLFEKSRVTVADAHVRLDDAPQHIATRVGHLPLAPPGLILLTPFVATDRLAIEEGFAIERLDELTRLVVAELGRAPIGDAAEDLRDRRLRHLQLARDLALGPAGRVEVPRALGARVDHGGGFMAAGAATMGTARRHPCVPADRVSTLRTPPPVYAVQRSRMTCT